MEYPFKDSQGILQRTINGHMLNTYISILAMEFGVFSSTLSLAVGIFIPLTTYALVIKKLSEAAMGQALVLAGPVCLMGVTVTGYFLGLALESCLSITSSISIYRWFIISYVLLVFICFVSSTIDCFVRHCNVLAAFTVWL